MITVLEIVLILLVLAVLVWGVDALIKLWPGNEPLKQAARIVLIVGLALFCLALIAGLIGVPMPWDLTLHRRR